MTSATFVLVPGAWMGGWVWADTAARLQARGHRACTLTLTGLTGRTRPQQAAAVRLDRHVQDVLDLLAAQNLTDVVLVGHSYSGIVVVQVADRVPHLVRRSVHLGSFLPRDGRSLIDDWGADAQAREAERRQIIQDGMLWAPPSPQALGAEPDLTPETRAQLAARFVWHPGRTVLDHAHLDRPVTQQPASYVTLTPTGADPHDDLPPDLAVGPPPSWRLRTLTSGHWPMLSAPAALADVLAEEAAADA